MGLWGVAVPKKAGARPVLALIFVITVAMLVNVGVSRLRSASVLGGFGAAVLYTTIPFGVWPALSLAMPHAPKANCKDLLPGAILFGVSFVGLHLFTVYWIARVVERKSATYGTVGAALALLLWAYVLGRMMTASAVLNAARWRRANELVGSPQP